MLLPLLDVICSESTNDQEKKKKIFGHEFQTKKQWLEYLDKHFGGELSVETILDLPGNRWEVQHFHALYVACWIFYPLAKGTFMLKLTDAQRTNVRAGYEKLGLRWTSHLHEHGRSARAGWHFLKGYHELLCQMEGEGKNVKAKLGTPFLFLKAEGHPAHHPMHFKSFFTKVFTGSGDVANVFFEQLAGYQKQLGISLRSAENYSTEYGKLLAYLQIKGKVATVQKVMGEVYKVIAFFLKNAGKANLLQETLKNSKLTIANANDIEELPNDKLADFIEGVVIPIGSDPQKGKNIVTAATGAAVGTSLPPEFCKRIRKSGPDLASIAKKVREDTTEGGRYFEEVKLKPKEVNSAIRAFKSMAEVYD